jgi:hypothetical protein
MVKFTKLASSVIEKPFLLLRTLVKEPPFRLFTRPLIKVLPTSIRTKANWDAVARPHYLVGVLSAADQAIKEGVPAISVIEFGVAGGQGLLALQTCAVAVERETGVKIAAYGFDTGGGMPKLCGDYRDHPDQWRPDDYPMDELLLRQRLSDRTTLLLGNVAEKVPYFVHHIQKSPIGFIAIDLDLYSSTRDALQVLLLPGKQMLRRVTMYFDDIDFFFNHKFAGELRAIDEFNSNNAHVKIDRWRGIAKGRVFPDSPWLKKMYVAHDIDAISHVTLNRPPASDLGLEEVSHVHR